MGSGKRGLCSPSPLLPLRNILTFGRFAGLPLKPAKVNEDDDEDDLRLEVSDGAYAGLLGYTALIFSGFGALWGVCYFVQGYDPVQFTEELMEQGMTTTEVIAMFCGLTPNLFVLVGYLLMFRVSDSGLQEFTDRYRRSGIYVDKGSLQVLYGETKSRLWLQVALVLLTTACQVTFTARLFRFAGFDWPITAGLACIYGFVMIGAIFPAVTIVTYSIGMQFMGGLELMHNVYADTVSEATKPDTPANFITSTTESGMHLLDLATRVTDILGPMLILEFGVGLYSLVFATFFAFLIPTAFTTDGVQWATLCIGFSSVFWTSHLVVRLHSFVRVGQHLTDRRAEICRKLEDLFLAHRQRLEGKAQANMSVLLECLDNPVAIQPLGAFDLGYSSWVSALLALLTNIIILLQFRFGEGY